MCFFIAFPIVLTLDVKIYGLVVRRLFISRSWIKMKFLSLVDFKIFTMAVYYLGLDLFTKTETIFTLVYPLWTWASIMISGTQKYSILFFATEHVVNGAFLKKWFIGVKFTCILINFSIALHTLRELVLRIRDFVGCWSKSSK